MEIFEIRYCVRCSGNVEAAGLLAGEFRGTDYDSGGGKNEREQMFLYSPRAFAERRNRATLVALLTVNGRLGR